MTLTKKLPFPDLLFYFQVKVVNGLKKTGGCSMCAFEKRALEIGKNFSDKDLFLLYEIAIKFTKNEHPFNLTIYNGGSFLNDNEISPNIQLKICQKVKDHPSIKKLFIESRVEFINDYKIKTLKSQLGNKTLIRRIIM